MMMETKGENPFVLIVVGSPRKHGNSDILADSLIGGLKDKDIEFEKLYLSELNIRPCRGCLRCNVLERCAIKDDDWPIFRDKYVRADAVVFAVPVYYHYVPGHVKVLLDRFRSLVHVQMTPTGLTHTPRFSGQKRFVVLMSMGGRDESEIQWIIHTFTLTSLQFGGDGTLFDTLLGKGLGLQGQLDADPTRLTKLFEKLGLPVENVNDAFEENQRLKKQAGEIGRRLADSLKRNA
jgi:multimeric flavodoxin WrbA